MRRLIEAMQLSRRRRRRPQARRVSSRWLRRPAGRLERLEARLLLTATARDGIPYVDLGTSDNVAWDQPRVTIELLTDSSGAGSVGPSIFNSMLLDTGASTIIAMSTAVDDMQNPPFSYRTEGKFEELGVAGSQIFDISAPYRLDFAGTDGTRNTLLNTRIISDPVNDFSQFGPWGVVGMPVMADRVTTLDFTVWETIQDLNLFMGVEFTDTVPPDNGHRYSVPMDNRIEFETDGHVVEGLFPPVWADVPFFDGAVMHNGKVAEGNFLFDTGAQVSVVSEKLAKQIGLDSNNDGVLDEQDANFARFETVGGIGGFISVPVFLFDEVHIPTEQGVDLVWTDLQWLVLDIIDGLDGVFGSDLMTSGWIEGFAVDGKSGWIDKIHLDFSELTATGQSVAHFDLNEQVDHLINPNGPGARIIESGGSTTVSEIGIGDTYQIALTQQPASNVTIALSNPDGQLTVVDDSRPSSSSLEFTPANWDVPQTVRVAAFDDPAEESFHRSSIFHVSTSSDPAFQGVGMPRVIANIIDNDFPGVMMIPTDGSTHVVEGGASDTYDVVLTFPPTENVTISLESAANQISAVSDQNPSDGFLIFTTSNWNVPQTVRVTAVDDSLEEGPHEAYISHGVFASSGNYQEAFAIQEFVSITDNEPTGGEVTLALDRASIEEAGGSALLTASLAAAPRLPVTVDLAMTGTATLAVDYTVSATQIIIPAGSTSGSVTLKAVPDVAVEGDETVIVDITSVTNGIESGTQRQILTIRDDVVASPNLLVTSLVPTNSGFDVQFNREINTSALNLFDTESAALGPADVVLQGQATGVVAGSLVVDPSERAVSFVKTGGPLEPDSYSVTLRSAADGFSSKDGNPFDGDGDGTPGDDFQQSFTIAPPAANSVVVSLPDFVRGPGQPVNIPADTTAGIPLSLNDGAGVRNIDLRISYDPALLSVSGATVGSAMPAGSTISFDATVPGLTILSFSSPSELPSGASTFVNLQASVPTVNANDHYLRSELVNLHALSVRDALANEIAAIDDDAVHVSMYFGDVSGNGRINASDASLVARAAAQLDSGFAATPISDVVLIGDVSGNGRVNARDASLVAQVASFISVPEIPPIPSAGGVAAMLALGHPTAIGRPILNGMAGEEGRSAATSAAGVAELETPFWLPTRHALIERDHLFARYSPTLVRPELPAAREIRPVAAETARLEDRQHATDPGRRAAASREAGHEQVLQELADQLVTDLLASADQPTN